MTSDIMSSIDKLYYVWLKLTLHTIKWEWKPSQQCNSKCQFRTNSTVHCVVSAGCGQALRCALAAGFYWGDSGGTTVAAANQARDGESQNAGSEGPRLIHPKSWQLRWILTIGTFISFHRLSSMCWTLKFMLSWSYNEYVFLLMIDTRLYYALDICILYCKWI